MMAVTRLGLFGLIAAGAADYSGKVAAPPAASVNSGITIYTAEMSPYDPATGTTRDLFYSTHGFSSKTTDTPANTVFSERIKQAVDISRHMFGNGRTFGRPSLSVGDLVLANGDIALDFLLELAFDGRTCTIRRGPLGGDYPADFTTFVLTIEQAEFTASEVRFKLRDRRFELNVPLQPVKYAGDNVLPSGLQGLPDDLKGKPVPILGGFVHNFQPPCVNTAKLIYQLTEGVGSPNGFVSSVRDRGVEIVASGSSYATEAELLDDALAPDPGEYTYYEAGGMIRLGSSPDGTLTAGGQRNDSPTPVGYSTGNTFAWLLERAGFEAGDWSTSDMTAIDAAAPDAIVSFWVNEEITVGDLMERLIATSGAWYGADRNGLFRIKQFLPAALGNSGPTFTANDLLNPLEREAPQDPGNGIPIQRVILRSGENYAVQSASDLAASVSDADRGFWGNRWRETVAENPAIAAIHPLAQQITIETLLLVWEAASEAEAYRRLSLYSKRRDLFRLTVKMDAVTQEIDLGDSVNISHPRFGLTPVVGDDAGVGHPFVVIGVDPDAKRDRVTLTVWGTAGIVKNYVASNDDYYVAADGSYYVSAAA